MQTRLTRKNVQNIFEFKMQEQPLTFVNFRRILTIAILLSLALHASGQRSVNCYFNHLCSCKLSAREDQPFLTTPTSLHESDTTTQSFQGQFGVILSETQNNHFDNDPTRLRGRPMALTSGKVPSEKQNIREISCIGVPFFKPPDFPALQVTHIDLVNAGLEILGNNILTGSGIESVRFLDNRISFLGQDAFRDISSSLKSLDLSYNQLSQFPTTALARLENLDWLNLYGNQIVQIHDDPTANFKNTVSTLFLGHNDLGEIPSNFFSSFKRLLWLNVDSNHLKELPVGSLPPSILTLSVTNNYLTKFPMNVVNNLPALTWFTLRGNYIESLPVESFGYIKRLDKLDLGENFITSIPSGIFNGTLTVNDLNLDYNYIEHLGQRAFAGVNPRRLYLGHNRIWDMHNKTFEGLENIIELIDLEGNRLNAVTPSFGDLKHLRYLFLSNNNITELPVETFHKICRSLKALSMSGNNLDTFPRQSLSKCSSLGHLNIGYNKIPKISSDDFESWAGELDTLIIRNNLLTQIDAHVFRACTKLRELSLSYNNIQYLDSESFRDIATSLESLEISFGLRVSSFPEQALKPLQKLIWLALDNNELETISETALYSLGELQYLNLESNSLKNIEVNTLHKNVHKNLLDVRLAYNRLEKIHSNTFNGLARLQTIVLNGNLISSVESEAFKFMPKLSTVSLNSNRIRSISPQAFVNLENLQRMELQFNHLREFSLDIFDNCSTSWESALTLNISYNNVNKLEATSVYGKRRTPPPFVQVLDASHNELLRIPKDFLDAVGPAMLTLDLSFNRIIEIDGWVFKHLSRLQELKLSHNQIVDLQKNSLKHLIGIQILDLSHNHLEVLQFGQFAGLSGLRVVILSQNRLRSLPRDVFQSTSVESVDLSGNEFVAMPTSALTEVSANLRHLNLSYNSIEHLDSTMFANMPHLISLSFAHNRLTILPDNIFIGVGGLRTLDLSSNPLRVNVKAMCQYTRNLNTLKLARVEMESLPELNLPELSYLDISDNRLSDISEDAVEGMQKLRHLDLSRNKFLRLPAHSWHLMPHLKSLDISWNPLRVLTKESFQGLKRLEDLVVQHLPDLKRFDADSLSHLHFLTNLAIQSWPSIEKYKFRLGSVISGLAPLRTLSARILERSGVLTDQILGAFGPKLKELELTGPLHTITNDAFEGIESYELKLSIRGTKVHSLPNGFIKMFSNVAHFTLDLSNNQFETLNPEVLYDDPQNWEQKGTQILKGGLALQENPWLCTCENAWIGKWLRRWMRETLQLHLNVAERNQNIQNIVRSISCSVLQEERVELFPEDQAVPYGDELAVYTYRHEWEESNETSTQSDLVSLSHEFQRPLVELNRNVKCQRRLEQTINSATSLEKLRTFQMMIIIALSGISIAL